MHSDSLSFGVGVGVDGCPGGWVYVVLGPQRYGHGRVRALRSLLERIPDEGLVFIDMPIGLAAPGEIGRSCDREARRQLGPRRSSVFATPSRNALEATSYAEACLRNAAASGRKLSRQAYNILPKIREVDALVRSSASARKRLRESHPELNFRALSGAPMVHNKRKPAGFTERVAVLERHFPGAGEAVAMGHRQLRAAGVARDDIVDAFINALAAARPLAEHIRLPRDDDTDEFDLPRHIHSVRGVGDAHAARGTGR